MLAPLHPLDAYRTDAVGAIGNLIDEATQSRWLGAALLLHNAARSAGPARAAVLTDFLEQEGVHTLRGAQVSIAAVFHAGVEHATAMEDAAFIRLAHSVLTSLGILLPEGLVAERGRLIARRARLARVQGAVDAAARWYEELEVLGRTHGLPELVGRSEAGFALLALTRGNIPAARELYERVIATPGVANDTLSQAHHGLMHCAVAARDFDTAAQHGWTAFMGATSDIEQTDMLVNLAQLLLDVGHPSAALRGFAAAIARQPQPRWALPAFGGAALSAVADCAGKDDERARARARAIVRSVNQRIDALVVSLGDGAALPFESASALIEVSEALAATGDSAAAARAAWRARALVMRHKFHQLAHRLDQPSQLPPVVEPTPICREVVARVVALEGAELVGEMV